MIGSAVLNCVLHLDADLVVFDKPSGLLTHGGLARDRETALSVVRRALGARVYPVHRLDRGTSGVLLFARTLEAATALGRAFAARAVHKRYLALVRGRPAPEGVVDHPIPRREGGARVPAVTRFRTLAVSPVERCALVEALPETGRLHQVRRHLKHISHPLIGDVNYGKGDINRHYRAQYGLHRLALHAAEIAFTHPVSGGWICVAAPVPPDLAGPLAALALLDSTGRSGGS